MALAKAFPDTYVYVPHEPTSVSSLVWLYVGDDLSFNY